MTEITKVSIKEVDLIKLIKQSGLTLKKLTEEAGVSYYNLQKASKGYVRISDELWQKIKTVLDKHTN